MTWSIKIDNKHFYLIIGVGNIFTTKLIEDTAAQLIKSQNIRTRSVPLFWLPLIKFIR